MRVLWFSNVPTPEMFGRTPQGKVGGGGHWVGQMARHLRDNTEIELGIASAYPGLQDVSFVEGGVTHFAISQPRRCHPFAMRAVDLKRCADVVSQFKPDLIHIHGSERFYGMLKVEGKTEIPTVIALQGLLGPCSSMRNFFGSLTFFEILRSLRVIELPFKLGLAWEFLNIRKGAKRETKILSGVDGFFGRTEWDRVHSSEFNQNALYCQVGEVMRPPFYSCQWSLDACERHTLIYTNAGHPRRGTENLLAAIAKLRGEFPDIKLRLAGRVSTRSGYGRFVRRRIEKLKLGERVEFLGYLDGEQLAEVLSRAHVFAITSYIENSPNSLAEAMLVGMPCVASFVGGIPDMVRDGDNGLLYPVDDVELLAQKIRNIFNDDGLAKRLAGNARQAAQKRHDPKHVIQQLSDAYIKVLDAYKMPGEGNGQ